MDFKRPFKAVGHIQIHKTTARNKPPTNRKATPQKMVRFLGKPAKRLEETGAKNTS